MHILVSPSEVRVAIPRRVPRKFMAYSPSGRAMIRFDSSAAGCSREAVHAFLKRRGLAHSCKWAGPPFGLPGWAGRHAGFRGDCRPRALPTLRLTAARPEPL